MPFTSASSRLPPLTTTRRYPSTGGRASAMRRFAAPSTASCWRASACEWAWNPQQQPSCEAPHCTHRNDARAFPHKPPPIDCLSLARDRALPDAAKLYDGHGINKGARRTNSDLRYSVLGVQLYYLSTIDECQSVRMARVRLGDCLVRRVGVSERVAIVGPYINYGFQNPSSAQHTAHIHDHVAVRVDVVFLLFSTF